MKNILFFTLIFILFTSCEDFFSTTLNVDPPPHKDQIVTSAFFSNTDTSLVALVNRSTAILENSNFDTRNLENSNVRLFTGDELLTTLPYEADQFQFNHREENTTVVFNPGQEYTLKVDHPDYEEASATIVVPKEIVPFRFELEEGAAVDEFGDRSDRVTVEFTDPADEENYYEVAVYSIRNFNNDAYAESHYITSLDFNLEESLYDASILSDQTFNGQDYKLQITIDRFQNEGEELQTFLVWRSVTKDYYQFARSLILQRNSEDFGPFSEPVAIKSNFEKGLGLFSINFERIYPL